MPKDYYDEKKELISDFNEAKFQIFRLHDLWQGCNAAATVGNLSLWKWKLDCIWRELSPDAKKRDDSGSKYCEEIKKLNSDITTAQRSRNDGKLYQALSEKEEFLRQLQDDVGKGSRRRSTDEDLMD